VLTDPADAGPVTLGLPQDVQAEEFDFPVAMFAPRVHRILRTRPDLKALASAAEALRTAERPLLVLGGGVRYSGAGAEAMTLAEKHNVPMVETVAGRTMVPHDHPLYGGPLGIIGSTSANTVAADADVVVAVGTRLQDFTTASWTGFSAAVRLVTVNAATFDAVKHNAIAVVGDARVTMLELNEQLGEWTSPAPWARKAKEERAAWDAHVASLRAGDHSPDGALTYAQVTGVVNDASTADDYVLTASGGMPGELHGGWRTGQVKHGVGPTSGATMDLEYGFSCMGYEVVAPWGAAMARQVTHPDGLVTSIFGDGSYLMLNSEIYGATFAGHPFVGILCDNGGYAVIHRLQINQGAEGFNNLLSDSRGPGSDGSVRVDFAAHAASLGAHVEDARGTIDIEELRAAYIRAREAARTTRRPAVVVCTVHHEAWTEAGAWWETGVPASLTGRASYDEAKQRQLRWL
jgi:3D-(3,5/4)-trihydroxycyclohexane-1,2-dione acylhydrolase (decyclizing)